MAFKHCNQQPGDINNRLNVKEDLMQHAAQANGECLEVASPMRILYRMIRSGLYIPNSRGRCTTFHEWLDKQTNESIECWLVPARHSNSAALIYHMRYLSFSSIAECCKLLQVVMTANAFVWSYIAMPHTPQEHAVATRVSSPGNS